MGVSSYEDFCSNLTLRSSCGQALAGQSTAWLLCDKCIKLFELDHGRVRGYAEQFWRSGGSFQPPGAGPAPVSAINMGDAKVMVSNVGSNGTHGLSEGRLPAKETPRPNFFSRLVGLLNPKAEARTNRRQVEESGVFYCQTCGKPGVALPVRQNMAFCSSHCRKMWNLASATCATKQFGVQLSDAEILQACGVHPSSIPKQEYCKWCGLPTMGWNAGFCRKCGGEQNRVLV